MVGSICTVLALFMAIGFWPGRAPAQTSESRKVKINVPPEYPELARKLKITGVARVRLLVAPDGSVKDVKEMGGNPVLVEALVRAVKKWKYEAADHESAIEVKFEFVP